MSSGCLAEKTGARSPSGKFTARVEGGLAHGKSADIFSRNPSLIMTTATVPVPSSPPNPLSILGWTLVALLGAGSIGVLAWSRGEPVNALWMVVAALCVFAISYRFHSAWLMAKVLTLDELRATPATVNADGRDFVKTNKWVVFGHHFAAIAGPGPLVGPVLAAQFGYLPGMLWMLIGATMGGAVHDSVILFCSTRRRGKSLGQMVRDEVGPFAGSIALVSIAAIMVILLAVLALVVVKALAESPWGLFTIACTMPIAVLMGLGMRGVGQSGKGLALTKFIDGSGPVFAGPVFPFVFITIACAAISGFHSLISSGTTPKLLGNERDIRIVGYGAMVTEMCVGIMALIAACAMEPGQYFAINMAGTPEVVTAKVTALGFPVTTGEMSALAASVGEKNMVGRTGGAPTFAVGMAHMFAGVFQSPSALALWYHFAIMFEALFILTTIDAGTRVGRFIVQDLLGTLWKPLGNTQSNSAGTLATALFVGAWGYFLYQGVVDPLGGINSLWPIFGIANQLLAVLALALGTTVLIKMGRTRYVWVTLAPLCWLLAVTMSAGLMKIFSPAPLGFLALAKNFEAKIAAGGTPAELKLWSAQLFNNRVDAIVTGTFLVLVVIVLLANARVWWQLLAGKRAAELREEPYVTVTDGAKV